MSLKVDNISRAKSDISVVLHKKITIGSPDQPIVVSGATDIVGHDNQLWLYRKNTPIEGQTPQDIKTIGGQTLFGTGNIDIPVNLSDLKNDVEFVNRTVQDLEHYYTIAQIDKQLQDIEGIRLVFVTELPEIGQDNILYCYVQDQKLVAQYLWYANSWQLIGNNVIDPNEYYTKHDVDQLIETASTRVATENKVGGLKSAALDYSQDHTRTYVKVDVEGFASIPTAKIGDAPNAAQDIVDTLNEPGVDLVLQGGNAYN